MTLDPPVGKHTRVGFVGIGKMGLPMVANLRRSGWDVRAVDVSEEAVKACIAEGVPASTDSATLAGCSTVIVIVATSDQTRELLNQEVFATGKMRGATLIVMSTIGPPAIRQIEAAASNLQMDVIDCPVTGGVNKAAAGTLTLFSAGRPDLVDPIVGLLETLGTVVRCGNRVGDGQSFKLVNNMLALTHLVVAAEAIGFAEVLGLDVDKLLSVLPRGTAASWILSDRGSKLADRSGRDREVATYLDIMMKDSALIAETAASLGYPAPLAEAMHGQWRQAAARGLGREDDTAIIEIYRHPDGSVKTGEA